jgi:hypothetical protein
MSDRQYYWLAIRNFADGVAVVPAPDRLSPMSTSAMAQVTVGVGQRGRPTIWSDLVQTPTDRAPDFLFGYRTEAAREASFQKLLNAPIPAATAEAHRCQREQAVIEGRTRKIRTQPGAAAA